MIRIDVLPDDVLLEIFDFYMILYPSYRGKRAVEAWQSLVHVCRRWRNLVFQSPRRLNLRLYCTPETPARDKLDVWPTLPLIINDASGVVSTSDTDNIIAAFRQNNRVCKVILRGRGTRCLQLEKVLAAMQVPFPELTVLELSLPSDYETLAAIPDSFLGGSAPRLRHFYLDSIPFPGLPKLRLSPDHLVSLQLHGIPRSGYISPEAIVALLSVLSSLKSLTLAFEYPQSHPGWESRSLPPPKRSILPAFYEFYFEGATEYLEDLVTFIDAPQLNILHITFHNQIDFAYPRLARFINCTPNLRAYNEAYMRFNDFKLGTASVKLLHQTSDYPDLMIDFIYLRGQLRHLSSIKQVCDSLRPLSLSTVGDLFIEESSFRELGWENDAISSALWLGLLLPFTAVKNLYLSKVFVPGIAAALQDLIGGRITEVLPNLQNIFIQSLRVEASGPFHKDFGQFVTARQLSGHPVAISNWDIYDAET
jgi:hypothetical protein